MFRSESVATENYGIIIVSELRGERRRRGRESVEKRAEKNE